MILLINKTTKTPMWVSGERLAEYLAAGHKLAAEPQKKPTRKKKSEGK